MHRPAVYAIRVLTEHGVSKNHNEACETLTAVHAVLARRQDRMT